MGAHEAEELADYKAVGWLRNSGVIWVEAQEDLAKKLVENLDTTKSRVINAAIWDKDGVKLVLKITTNSQSTSLLELGTHKQSYPDIKVSKEVEVITKRLDSVVTPQDNIELLVLDIQGVELRALVGMGVLIQNVNWIYTECNSREVYKGCAIVGEMDLYLKQFSFMRVATRWVPGAGWGDCLYVNTKNVNNLYNLRAKMVLWQVYNLIHVSFAGSKRSLRKLVNILN